MNNKGFTLLELLLSLTILAVMVGLVFGAFWTGIRSWEKSEAELPSNQRLRVVPTLLEGQLASLSLPRVLEKAGKYLYFRGSADVMEFFSTKALSPIYKRDIVYVRYRLDKEGESGISFGFYEKDIFSLDPDNLTELAAGDFYGLLTGYNLISFSYLGPAKDKKNGNVWLASWKPEEQKRDLPLAVKIEFQKSRSSIPFSLVVPIQVEL